MTHPTPPIPLPTSRPARVAVVTAGLVAAGSVVGGACAALAAAVVLVLPDVVSGSFFGRTPLGEIALVLALAGLVGAVIGGVTAPPLAWGLLRRVPLGRAIAGTAVGTVVGGVAGWLVTPVAGAVAGALLGFVTSAVYLRARAESPADPAAAPGAADR